MTLCELNSHFSSIMFEENSFSPKYKGFTVGKGKTIFWHIGNQSSHSGKFKCYPQYEDGSIGYPRYFDMDSQVNLIKII